jgi:hypothetical protein
MMAEWLVSTIKVMTIVAEWLVSTILALRFLLPLALWVVVWLFGVNWAKLWPALAKGAWAPLVLLMLISADAWSQLAPAQCDCLGFVSIPNYWWQLGTVILLVLAALGCGWFQVFAGLTPPEYPVNPAPAGQGHGHDHGHPNGQGHDHRMANGRH